MDHQSPTSPDPRDRDHSSYWQPPGARELPGWPADSWVDPHAERALLRRRLQRYNVGFACLSLALIVASLSMMGSLIMNFGRLGPIGALLGIPHWRLIEQSLIVWPSLFGVLLLNGPWPDASWRRRSGLLLVMCVIDAVVWAIENAVELHLSDVKIGNDWLLMAITNTIGWSEFALIASLAGDMAAHLGEPQGSDLARGVRSLATTGAMIWFAFFYFSTDWTPPVWPLRHGAPNHMSFMLMLSWMVLGTINFFQSGVLSLLASRCCAKALRSMAIQEKQNDLLPSRSEDGWEEFNRRSGPDGNP